MKESDLQLRISKELKKKLKDFCDKEGMSMSEAVRMFIRNGINQFK